MIIIKSLFPNLKLVSQPAGLTRKIRSEKVEKKRKFLTCWAHNRNWQVSNRSSGSQQSRWCAFVLLYLPITRGRGGTKLFNSARGISAAASW